MEFSYSQTENFEMENLSSDTGYFKKPVEINRGSEKQEIAGLLDRTKKPQNISNCLGLNVFLKMLGIKALKLNKSNDWLL